MTADEIIAAGADAFRRSNVTQRIEDVRERAGGDAKKLAALANELVRELKAEFPDSFIAGYARSILENYVLMARAGLLPSVPEEPCP